MNRTFPALLEALHAIEIDYDADDCIDFEPFDAFMSQAETSRWIKAWTDNESAEANEYLLFGRDGSGGYVAFWCVRPTDNLLEQPIVFFGSEGELGVIARNFYDYVWLFANGIGPYEAVAYPDIEMPINPEFVAFAEKHAAANRSSVEEIIAKAQAEFPDFADVVANLCQQY